MALTAVWYHERELAIALDADNPAHSLPPVLPHHKRILDVGCGMGQTLLALRLPPDVEAYGVDPDLEAIEAGRRLMPANVNLMHGRGEALPFGKGCFDLLYSRVALPYMDIHRALAEFARVLRPGGELWLSLISVKGTLHRIRRATSVKDVLTCGFVLLNGALFHCTGHQLTLLGKRETFQTRRGMLRAFERTGLDVWIEPSEHFIITGVKRR